MTFLYYTFHDINDGDILTSVGWISVKRLIQCHLSSFDSVEIMVYIAEQAALLYCIFHVFLLTCDRMLWNFTFS